MLVHIFSVSYFLNKVSFPRASSHLITQIHWPIVQQSKRDSVTPSLKLRKLKLLLHRLIVRIRIISCAEVLDLVYRKYAKNTNRLCSITSLPGKVEGYSQESKILIRHCSLTSTSQTPSSCLGQDAPKGRRPRCSES